MLLCSLIIKKHSNMFGIYKLGGRPTVCAMRGCDQQLGPCPQNTHWGHVCSACNDVIRQTQRGDTKYQHQQHLCCMRGCRAFAKNNQFGWMCSSHWATHTHKHKHNTNQCCVNGCHTQARDNRPGWMCRFHWASSHRGSGNRCIYYGCNNLPMHGKHGNCELHFCEHKECNKSTAFMKFVGRRPVGRRCEVHR